MGHTVSVDRDNRFVKFMRANMRIFHLLLTNKNSSHIPTEVECVSLLALDSVLRSS